MYKFVVGVIKLKLVVMVVALLLYLLVSPPEQRGDRLRDVGAQTFRGIENLAGKGREMITNEAGDFEALQSNRNSDLVSYRSTARSHPAVLPDDFRQELAAAVKRLGVVAVTERWQPIEHANLSGRHEAASPARVIHEAASLAALFRHDSWLVAGRSVPTNQLEEFLGAYASDRRAGH